MKIATLTSAIAIAALIGIGSSFSANAGVKEWSYDFEPMERGDNGAWTYDFEPMERGDNSAWTYDFEPMERGQTR